MNYYTDDREWSWLFKNAIKWDEILSLYYPTYPTEDGLNNKEEVLQFFEELLTNTGAWAGSSVKERAAQLDREGAGKVVDGKTIPGAALSQFYKEAKELGLIGMPLPREYGGLQVPAAMQFMVLAQLSRSCVGSSTQMAFFTSIAEMVHRYCDKETADRIVPQIINGELSGSMNLTEPGCGSDLGAIKTSATPTTDGKYLLNGSKIFITNGGGGVAFVLARIKGGPVGLEGISMFFVEQEITNEKGEKILNFKVAKNEEKMGMHASFTCEIVYENTVGVLIGKENEGFKYMLHLMNEARIAVGMQGLGGIEAALDYAVNYATERTQFGKPLKDLPLMKRNLEDFCTERDAIRALLMDTISHYDVFQFLDLKKKQTGDLTKEEEKKLKEATLWTRKRTPLVKYYACEKYTELSQRALQVLGGYGFMKEYPLERIHRDSFGPLLYEGTSQIQALMALKDLLKYALKDPKRFLSSVMNKHPGLELVKGNNPWHHTYLSTHYRFKKKLIALLFKALKPKEGSMFNSKSWMKEENVEHMMVHAETLTQALCYMETLRVLCAHAELDQSRADLFNRYYILVMPRLEGIFSDWELRA
jgi:alkylation response protein AidB-like acyl-CoA dehydrogenase